MKVLHLNTTDIIGGAGIAAFRLHTALRKNGVESYMLVQDKKSKDPFVYKSSSIPYFNEIRAELDYFPLRFVLKGKSVFSSSWLHDCNNKIIRKIKPDIIHLHWIAGGFIKIENLKKPSSPIIWSLHDMWPFTGGCHYDNECNKYKSNCIDCPMLKTNSKLSRKIFNRKETSYKQIKNLHINGLSKWLSNCAKDSKLFSENKISNIPNCIDINEFYPIDKLAAKKNLGIDINKKNILFGAVAATKDKRKGFDLLKEALFKMKTKENKTFSVFGSKQANHTDRNGFKFNYLGHISNIELLRTVYSAADVIVIPSRQENLSNVVMEALACGTPVVAFDIGGMPDMISHKENGYLAKGFNTDDLLNGIEWLLNNSNLKQISENAHQSIKNKFLDSKIATQYIDVYSKMISENR